MKKTKKRSQNIQDMRPGHSGDPFFEAQRRLNENQAEYTNLRGGKNILPAETDAIGGLIRQMGSLQIPLPTGALTPDMSRFPNAFDTAWSTLRQPADLGNMTVPVTYPQYDGLPPQSFEVDTHIRNIRESHPTQRSLTAKKKGRVR